MKLLDRLRWKPRLVTVRPLAIDLGLFVGSQLDKQGGRGSLASRLSFDREPGPRGRAGPDPYPNIEASWAHTFELDHARLSIGDSPRSEGVRATLPAPRRGCPGRSICIRPAARRARALGVACVARRRGWSGTQALREAESRAIRLRSGALKRFLLESRFGRGPGCQRLLLASSAPDPCAAELRCQATYRFKPGHLFLSPTAPILSLAAHVDALLSELLGGLVEASRLQVQYAGVVVRGAEEDVGRQGRAEQPLRLGGLRGDQVGRPRVEFLGADGVALRGLVAPTRRGPWTVQAGEGSSPIRGTMTG